MERAGNDGYTDDHMGAIFKEGFSFSGYERDLLMLNLGAEGFFDVSGVSGIDSISDGRGSLFADFDNDGDGDVFLTTAQRDAHYLFRNEVGSQNGFVRVELIGEASGRDAFGSIVRVTSSAGTQAKLKAGGAGYLSQSDPRLLFGIGADPEAQVTVVWPTGREQVIGTVAAGSSIRVVEGRPGVERVAESRTHLVDPLGEDEAFLSRIGLRVGESFPTVALRSAGGEPTALADFLKPGRRLVVNLWATWCGPCAEEIPELVRLSPGLSRQRIDLLGLSVDLDTVDAVPAYAEALSIPYPVVTLDRNGLERLYPTGESIVPLSVLVDEAGVVREIVRGWSPESARHLLELARQR